MMRRPLTIGLAVSAALVLLVTVSAHMALTSARGRDWLRERICRAVSGGMQGWLEIDEIAAIELPRVHARGVRIVAPDGVPAIDVASADILFDLSSFLTGDYVWHRADIRDGLVRVTEDARGKNNMEETFKAPPGRGNDAALDMRTMVTSNMRLEIYGGELPTLRLVDIHGIMRVKVDADGATNIRFDDYRGNFVKGLPHGKLRFRGVQGYVQNRHDRLLRFKGSGEFEDEPVAFDLDIFTEPKKRVLIDADFPRLSYASLSTLGVASWSKLTGGALDIDVHHGR